MGLILRQVQNQLYCADDARRVLSDEERALATHGGARHAMPKRRRLLDAQGGHEAHGRSAFHAIDQEMSQFDDLGIRYDREAA